MSLADGLVHVLLVTLYVCAAMATFGAIALAISTFTEHAIGAIAAAMIIVVASEVVDNIPQFAPVAPYIPTHWWLSFDSLLRTPIDTTTLWHGLLSFAVYAALFISIAWGASPRRTSPADRPGGLTRNETSGRYPRARAEVEQHDAR